MTGQQGSVVLYSDTTPAMWHILYLTVRSFGILIGLFCVLTARVLYPGEEGRIQSKLEDFWIRVDDFQKLALSRHAAFMIQVAKVETTFLDKVFGKPTSAKALAVSVVLSGFSLLVAFRIRSHGLSIASILFALLCGAFASIVGVRLEKDDSWLGYRLIPFAFLVWFVMEIIRSHGAIVWSNIAKFGISRVIEVSIYSLSFLCDFAFAIITRKLILWAGSMKSSFKISSLVVLNVLLAGCLIGPGLLIRNVELNDSLATGLGLLIGNDRKRFVLWMLGTVSLSNLYDAVLATLFVIFVIMFLIHRAIWPLLNRTLFRMQDIGTKGRRAILTAVGLALLSASVFGGKFPELLKDLLKVVGG